MWHLLRHIGLVLLASVYLFAVVGSAQQIAQPSYTGTGPSAFAPLNGIPKEVPKKSITTRRHLPLVKLTLLSEECLFPAADPSVFCDPTSAYTSPDSSSYRSYLFSRFGNRAPPIA